MIKTIYDVDINIDGDNFAIKIKEPTKAETQKIQDVAKDFLVDSKRKAKLSKRLESAKKEYELNNNILKQNAKTKILKEQKELLKKIDKISDEIDKINDSEVSQSELVEKQLEMRFEMLVSGNSKEKLHKIIQNKGISYITIFETIHKLIGEAKEKK